MRIEIHRDVTVGITLRVEKIMGSLDPIGGKRHRDNSSQSLREYKRLL